MDALIDRVAKAVVNELEQRERVRAIARAVIRQIDERAGQQETAGTDAESPPGTGTTDEPEQEESNGRRT